ncbi:uncharacterized protein A1O5_12300 [Cladophialophora psammophila CBS 110553]|uniref:Transcription factor domain-containing protein n=1 Tax=Cladophialophora psammophila CBS 110553 TaxID=1182543 RepID=W9WLV7_9EURO|nr:uncharacterized protein A1O5_12300 [Cladophialophora psammophila CBS 110553]EXJ59419.1 hypothetical protein A1O5_12300 [Cladophialophora psammophila CBS 110553]
MNNAFVIFNNLPPRLMIKEATLHLACPEACFQATDGADCVNKIRRWYLGTSPGTQLSYLEGIELIRQESMSVEIQCRCAFLGPLNLFALTSSLHGLIFQYQHCFREQAQLVPIRNAAKNWGMIWQMYSEDFSASPPHAMVTEDTMTIHKMCNRVGFMRHAPEFWLLAKLMMDRITNCKVLEPREPFGSLVPETPSATDDSTEPIYHEYDQTSMQQVNDLITILQRIHIQ